MKPFIKICGITNSHDLDYVTSLDIDAVGFNLFFESKRHVNTSDLNQLYKLVPEHIHIFLIFVNAKEEFVSECLNSFPDAIPQFHGDETIEYCESFDREYIKAIRVRQGLSLEKINATYKSAKMLLFDSYDSKEFGGTGQSFNLSLLNEDVSVPFLVAGGINASNFKEALLIDTCIGVDICSSIEKSPGRKDHSKTKDLVEKIRSFHV